MCLVLAYCILVLTYVDGGRIVTKKLTHNTQNLTGIEWAVPKIRQLNLQP